MTISVGDQIPSVALKEVSAEAVTDTTSDAALGSGTVVMFTVPGAFTPTCHLNHLPGYIAAADALYQAGADQIVCATVNDHHVVKAWAAATEGAGQITFLADGLAAFAKATGLERDLSQGGLGVRFSRSALIAEDGVVRVLEIEDAPGKVTNSGAESMLERLRDLKGDGAHTVTQGAKG